MVAGALVARRGGGGRWRWAIACAAADVVLLLAAVLMASGVFHLARLWAWLAFLYLPAQLFVVGLLPRPSRPGTPVFAAFALALWGIAVDAFLIEPRWLEVTSIELGSPRVAAPVRIVVLADLQTDRIGSYERRVLAEVAALDPDLVLLPGDYLQLDRQRREREAPALRALLGDLDPPLGAFAVRGNVEADDWTELFAGTPVTALASTRAVRVADWLTVTGLSLSDSFDTSLRLRRAATGFHVVFGHGPDFALGEVEADLLVAGHTHGGQVRLPWIGPPLTLSAIPRAWAAGATELGAGRTLVVSRGIGLERGRAPRLRFLCRPQLVVIDLAPAASGTTYRHS